MRALDCSYLVRRAWIHLDKLADKRQNGPCEQINKLQRKSQGFLAHVKGALCSFLEAKFKLRIHYLHNNELIIQKQMYLFFQQLNNKLLSEENKVPEHWLKPERWQGPPHINKNSLKLLKVSLFIQRIQSWKCRHLFDNLGCSAVKINQYDTIFSLMVKISSQNLHSVPLNVAVKKTKKQCFSLVSGGLWMCIVRCCDKLPSWKYTSWITVNYASRLIHLYFGIMTCLTFSNIIKTINQRL